MRYTVRASHQDGQPTIFRVYDGAQRVYAFDFTREALAEACCRRLNADHARRLRQAPELIR